MTRQRCNANIQQCADFNCKQICKPKEVEKEKETREKLFAATKRKNREAHSLLSAVHSVFKVACLWWQEGQIQTLFLALSSPTPSRPDSERKDCETSTNVP